MNLFSSFFAHAQEATTSAPHAAAATQNVAQQPNPFLSFLPFVLIFGVFYFLLIRPQKKKMAEEQDLISKLGKGDEVFTKAGVLGTITGLTEKIVTLEVAKDVRIKVLRSQIGGSAKSIFEKPETAAIAGK
jgi:preprotein translocase subunit YajC